MLISHRNKFIYTKTIKTGGTSVESYFERFCMPDNEWDFSESRDVHVSESGIVGYRGPNKPENCLWWNHMEAKLIKERVGTEIWKNYFKFCVIRNPFDKAISAFYFFRDPDKRGRSEVVDLEKERTVFENFLLEGNWPVDRDKYLIDQEFCLDDVIRYETLEPDIERLCERLSIPWTPRFLPKLKAGIRPEEASVEELYTKKSREIVERVFAFELDYFNYSFPG